MSKKAEGLKPLHPHRTSVEQLLKCYGSDHSRTFRKTETSHVISQKYSDASALSHLSVSRHLEPRLRPQTCAACRACVSSSFTNSMPDVLTMHPLDQTHHLPYYCAKDNKRRPKGRHKTRTLGKDTAQLQLPHSRSLASCNCKPSSIAPGLAPSCSSRLSGEKAPSVPHLPALPQPVFLPTDADTASGGYNGPYHLDPQLRQWIVEFGGDEQAAFMARGLQKLQLAYELGKAEMSRSSQCNAVTDKC